MDDLQALYQELILDHNARPRNFGELPAPTHWANGHNPMCGDHMTLHLQVDEGGVIRAARFAGQGCAISRASASLMTAAVAGLPRPEVEALFASFHGLIAGDGDTGADSVDEAAAGRLGKLQALAGVRSFPMRVKCATLAWHTLMAALAGDGQAASTEG